MEEDNNINNEQNKIQKIETGRQEELNKTDLQFSEENNTPHKPDNDQIDNDPNFTPDGKFKKGNKLGKRFKKGERKSKEHIEKITRSNKETWTLKNFHQKMFETLTDIKLEGGGTQNFWKIAGQTIHKAILTKEVPMDKKFDRIMKTIQTVIPENKNLDINTTQPIIIKITKDEQDL